MADKILTISRFGIWWSVAQRWFREQLSAISSLISSLRSDVAEVKAGVASVKSDVASVQSSVNSANTSLNRLTSAVAKDETVAKDATVAKEATLQTVLAAVQAIETYAELTDTEIDAIVTAAEQ